MVLKNIKNDCIINLKIYKGKNNIYFMVKEMSKISAEEQLQKMKDYHSNYQKNRMENDPDFKQNHKERCTAYHNDPDNKDRIKELKLNYYYREKAKKIDKDIIIKELTLRIEKLESK